MPTNPEVIEKLIANIQQTMDTLHPNTPLDILCSLSTAPDKWKVMLKELDSTDPQARMLLTAALRSAIFGIARHYQTTPRVCHLSSPLITLSRMHSIGDVKTRILTEGFRKCQAKHTQEEKLVN